MSKKNKPTIVDKGDTPVGAQAIPAPQVAAPQNDPLPFGAPAGATEETPF